MKQARTKSFFTDFSRSLAKWAAFSVGLIATGVMVVYAMSYPTTPPAWEVAGGKFTTYFNNMFAGCPTGQVIKSFNANGTPVCIPVPTGDSVLSQSNCSWRYSSVAFDNYWNYWPGKQVSCPVGTYVAGLSMVGIGNHVDEENTIIKCCYPAGHSNPRFYDWSATGWTGCSGDSCTTGSQSRTVVCRDDLWNTVSDSYCSAPKPGSSQSCGGEMINTCQCNAAACNIW